MTRGRRALVRAVLVLALAAASAALLAAWLRPDNVLALWTLAAFCH